MPVAVAMLSAVIEHKIPTLTEVAALTVLSIGVMIAVWEGSVTGSVTGLILCIAALFSNAAMISTTGKVRRQASHHDQAVPQGLCCNRHATVKLDHVNQSTRVLRCTVKTGSAALRSAHPWVGGVLVYNIRTCIRKVVPFQLLLSLQQACKVLASKCTHFLQKMRVDSAGRCLSSALRFYSRSPLAHFAHLLAMQKLQVPSDNLAGCCCFPWHSALATCAWQAFTNSLQEAAI